MAPSRSTPLATIYTFSGSMWGAAAMLGLHEKGYSSGVEYIEKQVNLLQGENFSPEFLCINPKGTIPTLVVPLAHTVGEDIETRFKALTDSTEILEFLDRSRTSYTTAATAAPAPALAPATVDSKALSDRLIALVHSEMAPDGNMLLLSARDANELEIKSKGIPKQYLEGRQVALERYLLKATTNSMKAFLQEQTARARENGELLSIYERTAPKGISEAFFDKSRKAWAALPETLKVLANCIGSRGGAYLLGEQLSLADLHVGAWIARVLAVAGVTSLADAKAMEKLQSAMGEGAKPVPAAVRGYWQRLAARKSFEEVYRDGLH